MIFSNRIGDMGEAIFKTYFGNEITPYHEFYDSKIRNKAVEIKTSILGHFRLKKLQHLLLKENKGYYCFIHIREKTFSFHFYFVKANLFNVEKEQSSMRISKVRKLSKIHFILTCSDIAFHHLTDYYFLQES